MYAHNLWLMIHYVKSPYVHVFALGDLPIFYNKRRNVCYTSCFFVCCITGEIHEGGCEARPHRITLMSLSMCKDFGTKFENETLTFIFSAISKPMMVK